MYTIYDVYEGEYEKIGEVTEDNSYEQAYAIFIGRLGETDGECALTYRPNTPDDIDTGIEFDLSIALENAKENFNFLYNITSKNV